MRNNMTEPHVFVILGVTGDLARRKLIPAMSHLASHGKLHRKSIILGVGRRKELNDELLRESLDVLLSCSGPHLMSWSNGVEVSIITTWVRVPMRISEDSGKESHNWKKNSTYQVTAHSTSPCHPLFINKP